MKYFIIFIPLFLLPFFINAQITFTKIIRETPDYNCGNMIVPLPEDDAYMIGSSLDALWDGFGLYKLSPEGDTLWQKFYPTKINYAAYCFGEGFPTKNGYAFAFADHDTINRKGMLMTFDKEGELIFSKLYDGPGNSYDAFIQGSQNKDGSFILGGFTKSLLTDTTSVFIQKTDAEGNAEWDAYFKDEEYRVQRARTVFEDHDGGFIIGGWGVNHLDFGEQAGLVIKVDKDGKEEWQKKINIHDKAACDVYIRPMKKEEAYLVWACEVIPNKYVANDYISKWDENYEEVWRTSFDPLFAVVDVKELEDGRFIVVGYRRGIEDIEAIPFSGWLALLENDGTLIWHKDYRYYLDVDDPKSRMESRLDDVMPALDGGFIATGLQTTDEEYQGQDYVIWHLWVLKVDENGCIAGYPCEGDSIYLGDGPTIPVDEVWTAAGFGFKVYPNPVKAESLQISYRLPPSVKAARIELYTVTGQLVKTQSLAVAGEPKVSVSSKGLASGVYICNLMADGLVVGMEKVIIF